MPSLRRRLPLLAVLLLAAGPASTAQAAGRAISPPAAQPAPRAAAGPLRASPTPAERTPEATASPTASPPAATRPSPGRLRPAAAPVPKDSQVRAAAAPGKARPLRPRREPLLARHPAATCALDPLEAVGLRQHGRARDSLREFYWSDMARFFETSADLAEPVPEHVPDPAFVSTDVVLRDLPPAVRKSLAGIAASRVVDRLGEREFTRVSKLLASLGPAQVAGLLRADAPTLRGYVWTWLTTTRTGGCHLGHLDLEFIEAAVGDRSIAVEHGDDLVYRSLGDYALAARARLATLDPARFDAFLARLTASAEIDPLVRATAHGVLLRRGRWDTQDSGLRDPSPPVRAAVAAAAIEMNRDKVELALVEHAAADPADLVTELIVGALLGVYDPHNHGRPQLRGPLASTRDDRLAAAVARWRGRGDPLEPLPGPRRPLRFAPTPVPSDMPRETAPTTTLVASPTAAPPAPVPQDSPHQAIPAASATATAPPPAPQRPRTRRPADDAPPLPGVLDEPELDEPDAHDELLRNPATP